jgi:hypothetical protein
VVIETVGAKWRQVGDAHLADDAPTSTGLTQGHEHPLHSGLRHPLVQVVVHLDARVWSVLLSQIGGYELLGLDVRRHWGSACYVHICR